MNTELLLKTGKEWLAIAQTELTSIETYSQLGIIILVYMLAFGLSRRLRNYFPVLRAPPSPAVKPLPGRALLFRGGKLLFPIFAIMLLRLSFEFSQIVLEHSWVMQIALALAMLLLYHSFVNLMITHQLAAVAFRWIGMPLLFFHLIGVLDDIVAVLDSIAIEMGDIKLSAYGLIRVLILGSLLFWLGRVSSTTGQTLIRRQESLDIRTREVFAKLFEVSIFFIIVLLILQVMGINLTALAVFGGAVGVGLGFGLQAIASNFISGVIILLDRSVSVGDFIEMEDGRTGLVTELNMRSTSMETFDGKIIMVPNEKFITGPFTNWTRKNKKQRYRVDFSVAYTTDVRSMVELVKQAVASHPQVIAGNHIPVEERPDCEIASFGDSGINMFVEFWMEGIDDGRNRVGGDLLLIILETLQHNGIEIPFPQREVRVLSEEQNHPISIQTKQ